MPPPKLNDPERTQLWELALDTMENLRGQINSLNIEVAVIKTKIAIYAGISGAMGGFLGSLIVGVAVYFIKK